MSTLSIDVRRAKVDDAVAIAGVHDAAWHATYRGLLPGVELERMIGRRGPAWWAKAIAHRVLILILEAGGRSAGYATLGPSRMRMLPYQGEIYEIYLLPEYQGLGLGRALFKTARRTLAELKFQGLAVRVLTENEGAVAFYRRLGGEKVLETGERIGSALFPVTVFGWAPVQQL